MLREFFWAAGSSRFYMCCRSFFDLMGVLSYYIIMLGGGELRGVGAGMFACPCMRVAACVLRKK